MRIHCPPIGRAAIPRENADCAATLRRNTNDGRRPRVNVDVRKAVAKIPIFSAVFLLMAHQAFASCKDDLQELRPRVERLKTSNKERYAVANKWSSLATEVEPTDEVECHNYYLRAARSLSQPLEEVKNCLGPNTKLPRCAAPPAAPAGVNPDRAPTGPVTAGPPHIFTPPGGFGSTAPPFK